MTPVTAELAPAKVNLCLHVTGRRADGYHELDSVVAFADHGDTVCLTASEIGCFLQVSCSSMPDGAGLHPVPPGLDNLAWRALSLGARARGGLPGLTLSIDKRLPAGAGLGGGSSDAAAVLRSLARLSDGHGNGGQAAEPRPTGLTAHRSRALSLGADVPMCLDPRPWRARGIGERLDPVVLGHDLQAVLVWPGRAVATPAVFQALSGCVEIGGSGIAEPRRFGAAVPDTALARLRDDPIAALAGLRNDLTAAACRVEPAISVALAATGGLAGCRLARMTGSGTAVFGLFDDSAAAQAAAAVLQDRRPDWWVRATVMRAGPVTTCLV